MQRNRIGLCARALAALIVAAGSALGAAAQEYPSKLALSGGRIIPIVGEEIDPGTIVIDRGRIVAIGADGEVEIPYDAMEIDMSGKVLMAGMIHPQDSDGLDVDNEQLPVTPFLDVYDAIDPSRSSFEEALRSGITTVHVIDAENTVIGSVSRAVRPVGMMIDEMTVAPDLGLKLSTTPRRGADRMEQMATMRETFRELDDYLVRLAESEYEEKLKEDEEEITVGPAEARERGKELIDDEDYDDRHRNLVRLRRGDLGAWIYCGAATDVKPAIDVATEQGFLAHTVFVVDGNAHLAAAQIAATGRPVVLPRDLVYRDRDPNTGEMEETFLPTVFADAGVTFAMRPSPGSSLAERYLTYQAARCVREGMSRQAALEAITINPARMMGLEDRVGSLEVGKAANIVVFSDDPLDFAAWIEHVYIDGVHVYDRTQDPKLERLLDLEDRAAAQPEEEAAAEEGEEEDEGAAQEESDSGDDAGEAGDSAATGGSGDGGEGGE